MKLRSSLIGIMFFQFFSFGAINPVLSLYLQQYLHFSGTQTGIILSASIISSLLGPLIAVYVIDRIISSRWLLVLCHAVLAILSCAMLSAREFPQFLGMYIAYSVFAGPTVGLINAICFQNISGGSRQFGSIRSWGTGGWIAAGWLVSSLWLILPMLGPSMESRSFQPILLFVSAIGSIFTLSLALALPSNSTARVTSRQFIPRETWQVIKKPAIIALGGVYLISSIFDRFYFFGTGPFLVDRGFSEASIMPLMSLGQITELVTLGTLAIFLRRFGYATTFLVGLGLQVARFFLFWTGNPVAIIVALSLNGFIFAYVYTAIVMYIDSHTDASSRPGVHQIITFAFSGVSSLIGNLGAGILRDRFQSGHAPVTANYWNQFWLIPALSALALLLATAVGWRFLRRNFQS